MSKGCQKTSVQHTDSTGNQYCQCYNSFDSTYHLIKILPNLTSDKVFLCGKEGVTFPSTNNNPSRLKCVTCFSFIDDAKKKTEDENAK